MFNESYSDEIERFHIENIDSLRPVYNCRDCQTDSLFILRFSIALEQAYRGFLYSDGSYFKEKNSYRSPVLIKSLFGFFYKLYKEHPEYLEDEYCYGLFYAVGSLVYFYEVEEAKLRESYGEFLESKLPVNFIFREDISYTYEKLRSRVDEEFVLELGPDYPELNVLTERRVQDGTMDVYLGF